MIERPTRIGVQLAPQHVPMQATIDAARRLEDLGVDAVFGWDHFFPLSGDPDGVHFEATAQLAAWAVATERVQIGPLVFCNSYRNPDLLADMARTVDHLGGGRLILGIGAGWFRRDYEEYGYTFGTAPDRLRVLAAALPRIEARLARLDPPPMRSPLPMLIGGGGEQVTLRLVAEHASMWNSFGPPETYARKSAVLDQWCERIGRDPAEIERTILIESDEVDRAEEFVEAGAQHLIVELGTTGENPFDLAPVQRLLERRDEPSGRSP